MTFLTKSDTVGDNKSQFRIIGKRFNVMGMNFNASFVAFLAGIIIPFKNFFTPVLVFFATSNGFVYGIYTAFPITSFFTESRLSKTFLRAKSAYIKAVFMAVIRLSTKFTDFIFTFSKLSIVINWFKFFPFSYCATLSTTINTFFNKRRINIESFVTDWTDLVFAFSFSHHYNYNSIEEVNQYA